jgi:FAD:protein FMN transferase
MGRMLDRRRFIGITAAAAGLGAAPWADAAAVASDRLTVWAGTALGARASIRLHHPDKTVAERLIAECIDEIGRLERVFSLYRPDSALSRLNRDGALDGPPLDLVRLLSDSRRFATLTGGAFDPTVQVLWMTYAKHFSTPNADPAGPCAEAIARAQDLVGHRGIDIAPGRVAFARRGMGVTLNGIAQGYITDRIADRLRQAGLTNVLVDLGEARALGPHPDGRPWRVGLVDPGDPSAISDKLDLAQGALATSAAYGFAFDAAARFGHLLDPRTGRPDSRHAAVAVLAPDATTADALSTAFTLMGGDEIDQVLGRRSDVTAFLAGEDGLWRVREPSGGRA